MLYLAYLHAELQRNCCLYIITFQIPGDTIMTAIIDAIVTFFGDTLSYGGDFLISWCKDTIPVIFLVLILTNTIVRLIPPRFIERTAALASRHLVLKYMLIPFLGSILLTNPSALTLGRFMSEKDKPSYYASASFFCHTSSGIFPHINASELFIWLGIAHGVEMLGYSSFPLAVRYLAAGLAANFICGIVTDHTTSYYCRKMNISLPDTPHWELNESIPSGEAREAEPSADSRWHSVCIEAGRGGFGGPLILKPDETRNKLIYITGGGAKPAVADKIEKITGCTCVNGFKAGIPDEEVFLAVIDCGGTLRCGIYPKKRIPTVNILPTGQSGPLARFITEDIYVSAVTEDCITAVDGTAVDGTAVDENAASGQDTKEPELLPVFRWGTGLMAMLGRGCTCAYKAAQDSVDIVLHTLLPLMGFVSLVTAFIECSGLNYFLAEHLTFLSSSTGGLFLLGIIISFPLLSPILSPGAIIAQVTGAVIGAQIGNGTMAISLALPALFAINTQAACDFIPVGLGLANAGDNTIKVGVPSVLTSRFLTSAIRIFIGCIFSFGL